jgi:hypothetical protein
MSVASPFDHAASSAQPKASNPPSAENINNKILKKKRCVIVATLFFYLYFVFTLAAVSGSRKKGETFS